MNLRDILNQSKESTNFNKYEHPNITPATAFLKPAGEANISVRFGMSLRKVSITPEDKYQGKFMLIRSTLKKKVNNQRC